jgi:hypothetical protein
VIYDLQIVRLRVVHKASESGEAAPSGRLSSTNGPTRLTLCRNMFLVLIGVVNTGLPKPALGIDPPCGRSSGGHK